MRDVHHYCGNNLNNNGNQQAFNCYDNLSFLPYGLNLSSVPPTPPPLPPMVESSFSKDLSTVVNNNQPKDQEIPWFCNVGEISPRSGQYPLPNVFSAFQTPLYRNFYHQIEFYIPDFNNQAKYQNARIYISDTIGYSGNAKKFVNTPQSLDEVALLLEGQILDIEFKPLSHCDSCKDYFQSRFYFANNPQCKEKLILVKSNVTCFVLNGSFSFQIKVMCCSKHHNNNSLLIHLWLRDVQSKEIVMSSVLSSYIKQWKRSKSNNSNHSNNSNNSNNNNNNNSNNKNTNVNFNSFNTTN
ncbi:hypothetical protein CYY_006900 [Polysphondylium violaceum]|uniref:Uncharacterized protein n=1 Tax=Polysphondylium violaceum TaxID=133409 RepID=A0A8J4PPX5_9MYCE|nr:hypothetical protein CYY_006900 [Polysphondylium violaceum]